jgi:8-amino-7-oxononanoate synthase
MRYLDRIRTRIAALEAASLRREIRVRDGAIDFSSNDYLGMAHDSQAIAALRMAMQVGSGGARLLGGAHHEHDALERELAVWTGRERALLFSSGYLAMIGAVHGLARAFDRAYSDELNHACAIDGMRLAKLPKHIYAHRCLPPRDAREPDAMIVSESRFGMDGTRADVAALVAQLGDGDALVLDEAHALGVDGLHGAGDAFGVDDPRVIVVGTLSKAIGGLGGFVAGPADAIDVLVTDARTFMFDTALPPALAAAMTAALVRVRGEEGDVCRARLAANAARVRDGLARLAIDAPGDGPVIPVVIGDAQRALDLAAALETAGCFVPAIRPPTVPAGSARLRITVRADHTDREIDALLVALERALLVVA